MKKSFFILVIAAFFLPQISQGGNMYKPEIVINPRQLNAINIAVNEFKKQNLDVENYNISLYNTIELYIVIFKDKTTPESQRGSPPGKPTFEVEVNLNGTIKRANFSR